MRASLPIRMRGSLFSMPLMMRSAAAAGVVLATLSNRSIAPARRSLSVTPTPVRELRTMLVATPPGCTTDTRTGLAAACNSCRRLSEKPRTANFEAAYAVWPGGAMIPKMLERLTMWASRWRARCGRKARVECTTPKKLMLISHSICAWSISVNWPSRATPALLTTMLRPGWRPLAACAKASISLASATSTRCTVTFRECVLAISAATACNPASSRSASARSQPRAASSSASARPMPLAAPVTAAAAPRIAVIGCRLHVGKDLREKLYMAGRPWQQGEARWQRFRAGGRHDMGKGHVDLLPRDLADRDRVARHRRALYAGGGADQGIARQHRSSLRLHARHRAAYVGRHARACRGAAYQRAGVRGAEMVRGRLSVVHGLAGAARAGARSRSSRGSTPAQAGK